MGLVRALPLVGGALAAVLDRLFPDTQARADAEQTVLNMYAAGEIPRAAPAKAADDCGLFRSGWRPAAGWVCVAALAAQYLAVPLMGWLATNTFGWQTPPQLNLDDLLTLLAGLLGLGAFRTYERVSTTRAELGASTPQPFKRKRK